MIEGLPQMDEEVRSCDFVELTLCSKCLCNHLQVACGLSHSGRQVNE